MGPHTMLSFLLVALIACHHSLAYYKVTRHPIDFNRYHSTYETKKDGAAYVLPKDLPAIGRLLRDKGISQVWISHFEGSQYKEYELSIEMVPASKFSAVFESHLWLKYAPEPDSFINGGRAAAFVPTVVPIKSGKAKEILLHGLVWAESEDSSSSTSTTDQGNTSTVRISPRKQQQVQQQRISPQLPRRRQTGNPRRASLNLTGQPIGSEATIIVRQSPPQRSQAANQIRRSQESAPDLSIRPVFNPPPNPPASAFVDQRTGQLPPDNAVIMVPSFTNFGPLTPRGNSPRNNNNSPRNNNNNSPRNNSPRTKTRRHHSANDDS